MRDGEGLPTIGGLLETGDFESRDGEITCFKAMGMGLSDLAIAVAAHKRAVETGVGKPLGVSTADGLKWQAMTEKAYAAAEGRGAS